MRVIVFLLCLFLTLPVYAVQPDEMLKDTALESRAREISRNVRCLVCQGEAIDESNADLAKDLRKAVRARLIAGDTDAQVQDYLRERYGDYVLLTPPLRGETLPLWILPVIVLVGGVCIVILRTRKKGAH